MLSALRAVLNHLEDGKLGIRRVVGMPVMRLHEAWIPHTTAGLSVAHTNAAVGFLQNDSENEPVVNQRNSRTVLDRIVDILDHLRRIVRPLFQPAAGLLEGLLVAVPHILEADPLIRSREVGCIAGIKLIHICSGADAVFVALW